MNKIYIALGTNLGNKPENLLLAIRHITEKIGAISSISSVYESKPWGFESENNFLNLMLCVETKLFPDEVLMFSQEIEQKMGREKKSKVTYQDRIIDIDLITCDDLIYKSENLELPHPLFHLRRFVLEPFNEIAPDYVHPVLHKKVSELLHELS